MTNIQRARAEAAKLLEESSGAKAPVDVQGLASMKGIRVVFQEMEDSISGMLVHEPQVTFIAVNSLHHPNRQRFTIAHEIGHHMLHADHPTVFVDDRMIHFRADALSGEFAHREIEANAFAAELLMPEEVLRRDLSAREIDVFDDDGMRELASQYKVSAQALTIRIKELGMVHGIVPEKK